MNRMAIRKDARNREFEQACQILLLALIIVGVFAVPPAAIEFLGATLGPSKSAGVACNSCGVVEDGREVSRLAPKQAGSTVTGGGGAGAGGFLLAPGGGGGAAASPAGVGWRASRSSFTSSAGAGWRAIRRRCTRSACACRTAPCGYCSRARRRSGSAAIASRS